MAERSRSKRRPRPVDDGDDNKNDGTHKKPRLVAPRFGAMAKFPSRLSSGPQQQLQQQQQQDPQQQQQQQPQQQLQQQPQQQQEDDEPRQSVVGTRNFFRQSQQHKQRKRFGDATTTTKESQHDGQSSQFSFFARTNSHNGPEHPSSSTPPPPSNTNEIPILTREELQRQQQEWKNHCEVPAAEGDSTVKVGSCRYKLEEEEDEVETVIMQDEEETVEDKDSTHNSDNNDNSLCSGHWTYGGTLHGCDGSTCCNSIEAETVSSLENQPDTMVADQVKCMPDGHPFGTVQAWLVAVAVVAHILHFCFRMSKGVSSASDLVLDDMSLLVGFALQVVWMVLRFVVGLGWGSEVIVALLYGILHRMDIPPSAFISTWAYLQDYICSMFDAWFRFNTNILFLIWFHAPTLGIALLVAWLGSIMVRKFGRP